MSAWLGYVLVALALGCVAINLTATLVPIVRAERATRTRDETTSERVERTGNVRVLGRDDWGFGEWAS